MVSKFLSRLHLHATDFIFPTLIIIDLVLVALNLTIGAWWGGIVPLAAAIYIAVLWVWERRDEKEHRLWMKQMDEFPNEEYWMRRWLN